METHELSVGGRSDSASPEEAKSLAEELESLDIVEADELQEGVAFHAFQFAVE